MNDDKQILSKLSIEDYNAFLILTKLEDKAGLLKEESTSELLRFTTRRILSQILDDQTYRYLEQERQEQKKAQNNQQQQQQQQLHSQVILPSTTITATASQQPQVPNNISRRNNLVS
ncbi:MAG TPA: hypothetical protein VKA87_11635 [Nitrososphaeraceae archaeon]|nr:hypothetical protein [Nitrososphaeraceae archaeon]